MSVKDHSRVSCYIANAISFCTASKTTSIYLDCINNGGAVFVVVYLTKPCHSRIGQCCSHIQTNIYFGIYLQKINFCLYIVICVSSQTSKSHCLTLIRAAFDEIIKRLHTNHDNDNDVCVCVRVCVDEVYSSIIVIRIDCRLRTLISFGDRRGNYHNL